MPDPTVGKTYTGPGGISHTRIVVAFGGDTVTWRRQGYKTTTTCKLATWNDWTRGKKSKYAKVDEAEKTMESLVAADRIQRRALVKCLSVLDKMETYRISPAEIGAARASINEALGLDGYEARTLERLGLAEAHT